MGESSASSSKALAVASFFADNERYFISSGKSFRFYPIPTANYRLAQTTESIKTKGTLWQLNPSAADDSVTNTTWDIFSTIPLYAARYDSPLVSGKDSKTAYWEFEILSTGYEGKNAKFGIGLLVKDEASEAVVNSKDGNLRPYNPDSAPTTQSGPSLLWWSGDGGVYDSGKRVGTETFTAGVGDTIGVGVTFRFDESIPMVPTRDVNDNPSAKANKVSKKIDSRGNKTTRVADAKDLVACPTKFFITVNGVEMPLEGAIAQGFLNGTLDIYPVLLVSGPGVSGKVKIGEAVTFDGEGGVEDAKEAAKGNTANAGYKKSKLSRFLKFPSGGLFIGAGGGVGGGG